MPLDTVRLVSGDMSIFKNINEGRFKFSIPEEREVKHFLVNTEDERKPNLSVLGRAFNKEHNCEGVYVKIDEVGNGHRRITFEFSAKVLGVNNYLDGINENNLDLMVSNINKVMGFYFELDLNKFIDSTSIRRVHNTVNVPVSAEEVYQIIDSLKATGKWNYKKMIKGL